MIESKVTVPEVVRVDSTITNSRNDLSAIDIFSLGVTKDLNSASRSQDNYTAAMSALLTSESSMAIVNQRRDPLYIVVPITIIYILIFFTGLIGNVSTCVVIARNRSMHTATNYYLFSLAVSDLLLLISGLPPEMYYIWSHFPYAFGEIFCVIQSFAAETSANATVLTITAFTVERYVAICHPFLSHTMSKLSRAVKYVILIWVLALCLAIPQAIQFGIVFWRDKNGTIVPETDTCSRKWVIIQHAFEISTILFFVAPMTIITILYLLIGVKLRRSRLLTGSRGNPIASSINHSENGRWRNSSQRNVIRMLVAVVVAFFICWAPFHAQRLLAVYAQNSAEESQAALSTIYTILTYVSGVFYYLSTTVNPLLYNIMSNKFREAFKSMLSEHCRSRRSLQTKGPQRLTYSSLSRYGKSSLLKRECERNSTSFSASDENHKPTIMLRNDAVPQHSSYRNDERSPIVDDRSRLNFVSRNNTGSSKDHPQCSSQGIDDRSMTRFSESRGQMSTPIMPREYKNMTNENSIAIPRCLNENHRRPMKTVTLGLIAERLRFGTRNLFANHHQKPYNEENQIQREYDRRTINSRTGFPERIKPKFQSHPSIESANTISNSSLQDLDETEFSRSELATYMGQLNFDLVT